LKHLMWIVTAVSLIGVILNIHKKRSCFYVWTCTNTAWCIYDFCIGAYAQSALFSVYIGLAVWGIWKWGEERRIANAICLKPVPLTQEQGKHLRKSTIINIGEEEK